LLAGAHINIVMFSEFACELTTIVLFLLSSCVYTIHTECMKQFVA